MFEFIKNCFKYFSRNSVKPEKVVSEDIKITQEKSILPEGSGIYSISESLEDENYVSSEEFDDEKYAITVINKIIKQQRKIFKDIKDGKTQISKFTYVTLNTNHENFINVLKDIKSKDERDKYTYIYYKDLNEFKVFKHTLVAKLIKNSIEN